MPQSTRDEIFISYSHKDRKWFEDLQTMLKPLVRRAEYYPRVEQHQDSRRCQVEDGN